MRAKRWSRVGIPSPDERLDAYPHQFSGGMRQRVAIAIALLNSPDLIIADEPTTALDVTIQGQILYEMQKLTRETGTALIWITHDLVGRSRGSPTACASCTRAASSSRAACERRARPRRAHPYTQGLLDSVPSNNARGARLKQIPGHDAVAARASAGLRVSRALPACASRDCAEVAGDARAQRRRGQTVRCHHPLSRIA